jgi:hypothetical protein
MVVVLVILPRYRCGVGVAVVADGVGWWYRCRVADVVVLALYCSKKEGLYGLLLQMKIIDID